MPASNYKLHNTCYSVYKFLTMLANKFAIWIACKLQLVVFISAVCTGLRQILCAVVFLKYPLIQAYAAKT